MLALQIKHSMMRCEFADIAPSGWERVRAVALPKRLETHSEGVSLRIVVK